MFECPSIEVYFLATLGFIFLFLTLIYLLNIFAVGVKLFFLSKFLSPNVKQYGDWAVVTGSTDGIGKSYAKELAKRGTNIILVSRNLEKLRNTAEELEDKFRIKVKFIQADFTKGWDVYGRIRDGLKGRDIGILVNNVGISGPTRSFFLSYSEQNLFDIIQVNINSILIMNLAVLPEMSKRKRGAIVTMSSSALLFKTNLFGVYGASKAAGSCLSLSLDEERLPGIVFQTLIPGWVITNIADFSNNMWKWISFLAPDADSYAKSAINTLGLSNYTTGNIGHSLQRLCLKFLPETIQKRVLRRFFRYMFKKKYL